MQTFIMILSSILFGYACGQLAQKRGRNPNLWFMIGALFGLVALIVLALLRPPKNKHTHTPKQSPMPKKVPLLSAIEDANENKLWYYLDINKTQLGPMSINALSRDWQEGKVTRSTFVWNEGLDQWKYLEDVLRCE